MDLMSLASERMLLALRFQQEAERALEEGDIAGAVIRCGLVVNEASTTILNMMGYYIDFREDSFKVLIKIRNRGGVTQKVKEVVEMMEEIYVKAWVAKMFGESHMKSPSILVRNSEARLLVKTTGKVLEKTRDIFGSGVL